MLLSVNLWAFCTYVFAEIRSKMLQPIFPRITAAEVLSRKHESLPCERVTIKRLNWLFVFRHASCYIKCRS